MKEKLLIALVLTLIKNLIKVAVDGDTQRRFVDAILDAAKAFVIKTENKFDDEAILPLIDSIRANFNIPEDK